MTMSDPFNNPAEPTGGDKLPLKDLLGNLLLFTVHEHVRGIETTFGVSDAVRCDVAALDGAHKGEVFADSLVFPRVLQSQLAPNVSGMVLGRLGQGTAKPGKSAPWTLDDPSDADRDIGRKYLAHVATQTPVAADVPF